MLKEYLKTLSEFKYQEDDKLVDGFIEFLLEDIEDKIYYLIIENSDHYIQEQIKEYFHELKSDRDYKETEKSLSNNEWYGL